MKSHLHPARPTLVALAVLSALAVSPLAARADQAASIEAARQTTLSLIEVLVESGVLTRDKADAILKQAEQRAAQAVASRAPAAPSTATQPGAETVAGAPGARPVIRVPYLSDAARAQLRNEVREEVLAQARQERWGVPNAPSWIDRVRIEGDIRYRFQKDRPSSDNTSADTYVASLFNGTGGLTRAADFMAYRAVQIDGTDYAIASGNTQDARSRERLRARLGVSAKVSDEVGVGIRLATGNATDRVSTNQTLGQDFNKYQVFFDRAFLRLDPSEYFTLQAGRIPNPWFSTEMVWSENLNFEGVAATARWFSEDRTTVPFATVGWFPLREQRPGERPGRALVGAQVGAQFEPTSRTRVKLGLAYYRYQNLEGREDTGYYTETGGGSVADPLVYGRYEYGSSLRQRGNTLFQTNPADLTPVWGLAYKFEPVVLTGSAEFQHFAPFSLQVSAEYARNLGFDEADFRRRAGAAFASTSPGGRDDGYMLKATFGWPALQELGQWQFALSYRHVGSDAVLDAFTDSDLGLGGTNLEGYTAAFNLGVARQTTLGIRYLAGRTIDSPLNNLTDAYRKAKYQVNTLQVDLNVRF